jgi:hypothetical protein
VTLLFDFLLYALSAVFAQVTAVTSNLGPHRTWGSIAVWGYAGGALAVYLFRKRLWLTVAVWLATAVVPLLVLAWLKRYQEEVFVVEQSARRLIETGSPYLDRAGIAALPEPLLGYTPYQPAMSIFGLPKAIFGSYWLTDARVYFAIATAACLVGAYRLVAPHAGLVRAVQMSTVLPLCSLTLATGGDDMPVLALCVLAFALAARNKPGWAGVAIGLAAAMKLFAWPVVIVLGIYLLRRPRYFAGALGIPALAMIPPLLVNAGAFVENVIRFPTGHGIVTSPAASPLLGYLLAQNVANGRMIALALLGVTALALGVYVLYRRPADVRSVANICAIGLLAAIVLMPATRFGYLLYPVAFAFWAPCLGRSWSARTASSPELS